MTSRPPTLEKEPEPAVEGEEVPAASPSPNRGRRGGRLSRFSRLLARRFFQLRYGLLVRCIGARAPEADLSKKGTVIIQVDALGYANLQEAMRRGHMPFLKRLSQDPAFKLGRWRAGIPCDTPPVQAALIYGSNENVVGFYWLEKETGRRISGVNPFSAREVEERIAANGGSSIFTKGSTYGSIFAGQAFRSVMTVSALHPETVGKRLGIRHLFLFALLNPIKTAAIFANGLWDVLLELYDRLMVVIRKRPHRREGFMTLSRLFLNVIFREAASVGTRIDMYLGTPMVYAVFLGYDLVAHHSGPVSPNALRTLRGIDGCLRKIDHVRRWCQRDYDLYIISDHGMTPSVPFGQAYGKTLARYVAETVDGDRPRPEDDPADYRGGHLTSFLNDLRSYEPHVAKPLVPVLRVAGALIRWWLKVPEGEDRDKVVVVGCSPLAHVYLREPARRLHLNEVEALCPPLLPALLHHDGIDLVIALQDDDVVVLSKKGELRLGKERRVSGEYPLAHIEEAMLAERQIERYARMSRCGDLILFAAQHDGEIICFENQLGSHGIMGGDQYYAFMFHPADVDPGLARITEARDLHLFFRELANSVD